MQKIYGKQIQSIKYTNFKLIKVNKLALHFGAGNIGRGFIAPVLKENNVDKGLINKIKKEKHFDIKLIESKNLYKSIENIDGINLSDEEELNKALNQCSLVTTSVGPNHVGEVLKIVINLSLIHI